jgi:UDP-N-acetylmuramate--alanine ligase
MEILKYQNFYLVGIKGVGMASLAQLLLDAGKNVSGSDVDGKFVTAALLEKLQIQIDEGFNQPLPANTDCVIYTAAHQGRFNPQVQQAEQAGLPVYSHAEALGEFFNSQKGIAVCGVGGKTTTSAMITWILHQLKLQPSYSIGIAQIHGLENTGHYNPNSEYFVAEADEYATDPVGVQRGGEVVPRFAFLNPHITVMRGLQFDHPDVYRDFDHTKSVFNKFFQQIDHDGTLIFPASQKYPELVTSASNLIFYGEGEDNDAQIRYDQAASRGKTVGHIKYQGVEQVIEISLPGKYNFDNAAAAVLATTAAGVPIEEAAEAMKSFSSVKRRFERKADKNGLLCFDDYAHHPHEIKAVVQTLNEWYPAERKFIAFQPHTFSRTKELFDEFVDAFAEAQSVLLADIFASARESADSSVSSAQLAEAIARKYPATQAEYLGSLENIADYMKENARPGDVFITLGAGDIYQVHEML